MAGAISIPLLNSPCATLPPLWEHHHKQPPHCSLLLLALPPWAKAAPSSHPASSLTRRIVPEPLAHDQTALIVIAKPTCGAGSQLTLSGPCGSSCWIGRANEPSTC